MQSSSEHVLVIGSSGQIGTELVARLREIHGASQVIACDLSLPTGETDGPYEQLNVLDKQRLSEIFDKYKVSEVYLLLAIKAKQQLAQHLSRLHTLRIKKKELISHG